MYKVFFNDRIVFITAENNIHLCNCQNVVYYKKFIELEVCVNNFFTATDIECLVIVQQEVSKAWNDFQKIFKVIHAAGGLVKNQDGDLLVIQRLGVPDLPKGKVEKDETNELAAVREVKEECGLDDVKIIAPVSTTFHIYPFNGRWILKHTHWFEMKYDGSVKLIPQIKESITDAKWIERKDVPEAMNATYSSLKDLLKLAGWI
ncbi:MAG: NUDIX domain-containing protein [Bacteroidales bacterium]|nr:NUDIX domain-containing protein [Bacteroidales bacterium]